jgi:hypothetical protein
MTEHSQGKDYSDMNEHVTQKDFVLFLSYLTGRGLLNVEYAGNQTWREAGSGKTIEMIVMEYLETIKRSLPAGKPKDANRIRKGSIILHADATDEKTTGLVHDIDPTGTHALVLWRFTRIPHWNALNGLISREAWRKQQNQKHNKANPNTL